VIVGFLVIAAIVVRSHAGFGPGPLYRLGLGSSMPPPSHEEARSALGHPAPVAFPSGSYGFTEQQRGSNDPVTYDPCRPIHYVVNPAREPLGAQAQVRAAIAAVSAATGLQFIDDGPTTESYSHSRGLYQPDRYGRRWAPVLIDFTRAADNPEFADGPVGLGGSSYVATPDGHLTYVTGSIDIDADEAARLVADSRRVPLSAIIEHELGHVVGLAHVDDITQLMYPSAGHGVTSYGSGDLTGLARLGTGRCEPRL
jgi:Matrixin